jgi:hypothetical protein
MSITPLDKLSFPQWLEWVGTEFAVLGTAGETIELLLIEAAPGKSHSGGSGAAAQYENFSLLFHGPATPLLPQAMYRFSHEQAGEFDLFIVPVAKEQGVFHYQAIFNRRVPPPA